MKNRISGIVIGILLLIVAYQGGYLDSLFSKKSLACNSKEAIDLGKTIIEEKIFPRDFGKVEFVIEDIEFKSIFTKDINKNTGLYECTATTNILAHFDLKNKEDSVSNSNFFNLVLGSDSVVYVADDLYVITSPVSYTTQYTNDNKEYSVALKFDGDRTKGLYSKNMAISDEEAFRKVLEFAKRGNAIAQNRVGVMYATGAGTNVDYNQAMYWYEKAANQNNSWGLHNLGFMYYFEEEFQDYKKAFEFFKKSAELNNDSAQNYLGRMYYHGNYVNKDYKQSIYWYEKSNHHQPEDLFNLGHMYNKGFGTIQNNNKAFELFKQASDKGFNNAKFRMATMYAIGTGVEKDENMAFKLFEELAATGDVLSLTSMAMMYYYGSGIEKDKLKAKDLFDDACKKGYTKSCNQYKKLEENNMTKKDGI